VAVSVKVGVGVNVAVSTSVPVSVADSVDVKVEVELGELVDDWVLVGESVSVPLGLGDALKLDVGLSTGVSVLLSVDVSVGDALRVLVAVALEVALPVLVALVVVKLSVQGSQGLGEELALNESVVSFVSTLQFVGTPLGSALIIASSCASVPEGLAVGLQLLSKAAQSSKVAKAIAVVPSLRPVGTDVAAEPPQVWPRSMAVRKVGLAGVPWKAVSSFGELQPIPAPPLPPSST
jgi:hypothetical protein